MLLGEALEEFRKRRGIVLVAPDGTFMRKLGRWKGRFSLTRAQLLGSGWRVEESESRVVVKIPLKRFLNGLFRAPRTRE